jgi:hypothetical protein
MRSNSCEHSPARINGLNQDPKAGGWTSICFFHELSPCAYNALLTLIYIGGES